jgi:hypothetical protein
VSTFAKLLAVILLAGITPLSFAAACGQVIAARYFLDKGANPNRKTSTGRTTPLHEAAEAGACFCIPVFMWNAHYKRLPTSAIEKNIVGSLYPIFPSQVVFQICYEVWSSQLCVYDCAAAHVNRESDNK